MPKTSLKTRILHHLQRQGEWINGRNLEELAMKHGYKGSTASRICRDMAEDKGDTDNPPLLLREERKGKGVRSVWYKAITPAKRIEYGVPILKVSFQRWEY